jgi:serine/threonine-protein kinase
VTPAVTPPPAPPVVEPAPEPAAKAANCNPPYYFEGSKKIFKPACI